MPLVHLPICLHRWNYLQAGLDRIMTDGKEGIDTKTYMGLYNAIHNFCTAQKAVESGGFGANNGGASNRGGGKPYSLPLGEKVDN